MTIGAILGTLGVVAAFVAIGLWIDRRWGVLPRPGELAAAAEGGRPPPPPEPPGTAAAAPLRLTPTKLTRALTAQRCACGAALAAGAAEPIRYGDAELQLYPLACARCGAGRGLYVQVVAGD